MVEFSLFEEGPSLFDSSVGFCDTWNVHQVVIFVQKFSVQFSHFYNLTTFYRVYFCLTGGI